MSKPVTRTTLLLALLLPPLLPLAPMGVASAAAPLAAAPALSSSQLEEMRRMLAVVKGETILQAAVRENTALRASQHALFAYLFANTAAERQQDLILRVLARHVSPGGARSISEAYATLPGQRALIARADAPQADVVVAFNASAPALLLASTVAAARPEIEQAANAWAAESQEKLIKQASASMLDEVRLMRARAAYSDPALGPYSKSKVAPIEQMMTAHADSALRNARATRVLDQTLEELDWGAVLRPANLVSAKAVGEGQRKVEALQLAMGRYLQALKADAQQNDDELNKIDMPFESKALDDLAREVGRVLVKLAQLEKAHDGVIEGYRNILDFAAARQGKLSVKNGKLVIADKADQYTYAALNAKLGAARAAIAAK
ncbi:hypothetical protein [Massilia genomosp. 1]|uniref:TolC family protein n=1 Tax=Massilia genomosp. 1 TaxID=2609280 RepID=A0ABX0MSY2_9BURK|nr:hypothetical protein [Massilia genomosp. 1]NHZ63050.1 hypothetical protein [Massilia genomosp. 1]